MTNGQTLVEDLNVLSRHKVLDKYRTLPEFIVKNINERFTIREYQEEALARLIYFINDYPDKISPTHLLFNMATGSGKTFLMATNILYLYQLGYRNFIFFVNSTTIIKKTKANFLDKSSPKFLFADRIVYNNKEVQIQEVENFEGVNDNNINIIFTTIQGLHSRIWTPQENAITFEDFKNKRIVFLSDEAHHINALTKNQAKMSKDEIEESTSWENTVKKTFQNNEENIMLEYTATIDLEDRAIRSKYEDKIIYQYNLKEFREDKFSKDVQIMKSDLDPMERALQAVILSQYRRKVAEKYKIPLKPVVLIKAQKTIAQSEEAEKKFRDMIKKLKANQIKKIEHGNSNDIITKAFTFFKDHNITYENLAREIQEDFSGEKCIAVNSQADTEEKQILVNTLEAEHNEIRVIFTVNMLNEGWDVLNLFDIVRLYETRDTKHGKGGKTTVSEAQLIGRGARYYPFRFNINDDKFKRKYDDDLKNELRVLEELHYHSLNDSRYIAEIKAELIQSGIAPPDEKRRQITVAIKDEIKNTDFWKNTLLFINEQKQNKRETVKRMHDLVSESIFKYKLRTGKSFEINIFDSADVSLPNEQIVEMKTVKLNSFNKHLTRKALDKISFYRFCNLNKFFPSLRSINEFIVSDNYLGEVCIEIYGLKDQLENLTNSARYKIALKVLSELSVKIESDTTEYIGEKSFKGYNICKIFDHEKTSEILIGGEDKQYGVSINDPLSGDLRLDLRNYNWYAHDDNLGTSEEKYLIHFMKNTMSALQKKYDDVYLLRNENIFKIYRFSDGKAMAPDFVLFLTEKSTRNRLNYQIFIEPKGEHLFKTDQWKEDFLQEIESQFEIIDLFETNEYKIIGLPFFNEQHRKQRFTEAFNKAVNP